MAALVGSFWVPTIFLTMRKRKFPIHAKVAILVVVAAVVLVEVAMIYFSLISASRNEQSYKASANNLSATVSKVIDKNDVTDLLHEVKPIVDASSTHPTSEEWGSDAWNAYVAQFADVEKTPSFLKLRDYLREIESANTDVDCLYVTYVDPQQKLFVYLVDSALEEPCPPGCIDPIYDFNLDVLTDPSRGFPAYITNTAEYGWLVTAGSMICSAEGVTCYAMVDISLTEVRRTQADSIVRLFVYMAITAVVLGIVAMLVVDLTLIRPLRKLTNVAASYDVTLPERNKEAFENLNIKSHDEIGQLADSIKTMELDVRAKINELTSAYNELAQTQRVAEEMTALAKKDALTGVRNKTAFDADAAILNKEIASGKAEPFGIAMIDLNYLKTINDERGHGKGDLALIKLSSIICGTFTRSRVYRIGGDEFVALLRRLDYTDAKRLIAHFDEKMHELRHDDELTLEERISAAIGYAEFIPGVDKDVEAVLSRADKAMYGKKREMKKEDLEDVTDSGERDS